DIDSCITRLRVKVKDNTTLQEERFKKLGATGIIKPDAQSIQIVLGTKSESIASAIKEEMRQDTL
ncbi:MAG TPA: hypothetical protein ENN12_05310, partial [Epsilonproteobacteria bacterium]|nr:hypothetical protein [Campylobacterota bacterium]